MNGSKWAWIRDKCIELDYIDSANLAQDIENTLILAYGASDTKEWREAEEDFIENLFDVDHEKLFWNVEFCRGCVETGRKSCHSCEYAKMEKRNFSGRSRYGQFIDAFDRERYEGK